MFSDNLNAKSINYSLFVVIVLLGSLFSINVYAAEKTISDIGNDNDDSVRIIEPKKEVPVAEAAAIDTEQFELGLFGGFLAVEDFNTNPVFGVSFSYHITPAFMAQLNYGKSEVDRATFEENAGSGFTFLRGSERDFEYYNILAGYRVLRGRSFIGRNKKYNSDIYILGGFGAVDFAGDTNVSVVLGTSYRVVLTDSLVGSIDFRGHSVDRDFLNDDKRTFNTEFSFGLNWLF